MVSLGDAKSFSRSRRHLVCESGSTHSGFQAEVEGGLPGSLHGAWLLVLDLKHQWLLTL